MHASAFRQEVSRWLGLSDCNLLSQEQAMARYTQAFHLYERKAYRKAAQLFTTLVLTDPFAPHYWQGLASAKQMARDYEAALQAWGLLALLSPHDPLPHIHAAECLLAVHEEKEADLALKAARTLTSDPSLEHKIDQLQRHTHATH